MLYAALLLLLILTTPCPADPPVSVGAELSSTTAEIRIDRGQILLQLEIGGRSLKGFQALHGKEHMERFLREGFVFADKDGSQLLGKVRVLEIRPRKQRPSNFRPTRFQAQRTAEVLYVEIVYPLEGRRQERLRELTITPPLRDGKVATDIGFIVFHQGIQVIDFRFLSRPEQLKLDWRDPWYSRFRNKNLTRHHRYPAMSFLYVEANEVRHEILIRPRDLGTWLDGIDLDRPDKEYLEISEQEALKQRVAQLMADHNPVAVDGVRVPPTLDRIQFLRMGLNGFEVIDPPERISTSSALLGVIFTYPTLGLPQEVTVTWDMWDGKINHVPAAAIDEAGPLAMAMTPEDPLGRWQNFLKSPRRTGPVELKPPPPAPRISVPVLSVVLLLGSLLLLVISFYKTAVVLLVAGLSTWPFLKVSMQHPFAAPAQVSAAEATEVVGGLLQNIYRAFDHRAEEKIYDTLARSTSGDLLAQVYLETRQALEVRNQGGVWVKVNRLQMLSAEPENLPDDVGFVSRCKWTVQGSVGHWGHVHRRKNRYDARLRVQAVDGTWRVTQLELLDEQRLEAF